MKSRNILVVLLAAGTLAGCAERAKTAETAQAGTAVAAKLSDAPDRFIAAGDVRLRYREAGSGPAIVFIHGYSRTLEDMLALADSMVANHRVIAYDVRGFGQSSKSGDVHRYGAAMAGDVIALLDSLGIDRAHLVGHSMGALIAGNVAVRYPARVASATLIAGPFYADSASHARAGSQWVRDMQRGAGMRNFLKWLFPGMPDSLAQRGSTDAMAHNDSVTMIAAMQSMGGLAIGSDRATRATVPVSIVAAGNDPLAPLSRTLAKQWPNAQFVEVPGVNHGEVAGRPEVRAAMRTIIH